MLTTWTVEDGRCRVREGAISDITAALPEAARESAAEVATAENLRRAVWIDLLNPTADEERAVQNGLQLEIPPREESAPRGHSRPLAPRPIARSTGCLRRPSAGVAAP